MLTEKETRDALDAGAAFAIVQVVSHKTTLEGTRSQQVTYKLDVKRPVRGELPSSCEAAHWGAPLMQTGRTYLAALASSSNWAPALWRVAHVETSAGQEEAVVQAQLGMIERIEGKK